MQFRKSRQVLPATRPLAGRSVEDAVQTVDSRFPLCRVFVAFGGPARAMVTPLRSRLGLAPHSEPSGLLRLKFRPAGIDLIYGILRGIHFVHGGGEARRV
jgi:hypothetical protein